MAMQMKRATGIRSALVSAVAFGMVAIAGNGAAATLLQYNFSGNAGNEAAETPSFVAANLTGSNFTRGSGLSATSGANAFNSASWSNYTANSTDYLSFGFSIASGYTASVDTLSFTSRSSNTGPRNLAVLASIDGGTFQQVASFAQTSDANVNRMLSFAPLTGATSLLFRIVATSSTSANGGSLAGGGTFRVQNYGGTPASPFTLSGAVSAIPAAAVPEPAAWAMMIGGFGLVGAAMRRRGTVAVRFG